MRVTLSPEFAVAAEKLISTVGAGVAGVATAAAGAGSGELLPPPQALSKASAHAATHLAHGAANVADKRTGSYLTALVSKPAGNRAGTQARPSKAPGRPPEKITTSFDCKRSCARAPPPGC